ncbi:Na+/H+ antiporter subunit B [Coxiella burnetii]|uniref:Na+/H+ antiporter subunit B n=1 Tax=Coxiella burnetii TaxID=777 RepID=UPI0000ED02D3|nr:Na+/H+ antiporter subunit B [Coxiella burnetii]AIT64020.1 Putative monovalent cation/H+ antiporter subunit B [Coxiella burnetii str. Namibia]EAX32402.1 Na(+)/H(+) antiporter subunit B [Coxiella burnetii 'MSU Goat Q177']UYK69310.1 Na+/H+ antiporter subunit B [Coxiella burnetii]
MISLILYTASRFLLAIMLLFSLWVLFRGHNSPGGGFIAGLISASAFALYLITHGSKDLRRFLRFSLSSLLAIGLTVAVLAGLIALIFGKTFLTGIWLILTTHFKLGTPLLFDVGIYLVVLSSTLIIMIALEEGAG